MVQVVLQRESLTIHTTGKFLLLLQTDSKEPEKVDFVKAVQTEYQLMYDQWLQIVRNLNSMEQKDLFNSLNPTEKLNFVTSMISNSPLSSQAPKPQLLYGFLPMLYGRCDIAILKLITC
jgi:hypothetical protein